MNKIKILIVIIFLFVVFAPLNFAEDLPECVGENVYGSNFPGTGPYAGRGRHACLSIDDREGCNRAYTFNDGPNPDWEGTTFTWVQCNWDDVWEECNGHGPECEHCSDNRFCASDADCTDFNNVDCVGKTKVTTIYSCNSDGCCEPHITRECSMMCESDCLTDADCPDNSCNEQFNDFCVGFPDLRLRDYNGDRIMNAIIVADACDNICTEECVCSDCDVDCSEPDPVVHCVKGICGAECDERDNNLHPNRCDINNINGFGFCKWTFCGDGAVQRPNGKEGIFEECDDGNKVNGDGCSADCKNECINADIVVLRTMCGEPSGGVSDATDTYVSDPNPCEGRNMPNCNPEGYVDFSHDTIADTEDTPDIRFNLSFKKISNILTDNAKSADIMYVLDRSESMNLTYDDGTLSQPKIEWAKDALRAVRNSFLGVGGLGSHIFKLGLVTFNHDSQVNAFLNYPAESNFDFSSFDACGCTNISGGIMKAVFDNLDDESLSCKNENVSKVVILASDGKENRRPFLDEIRGDVRFDNITFFTIGIDDGGMDPSSLFEWREKLKDIAYNWGTGEGAYYNIQNISELEDIYKYIGRFYYEDYPAQEIIGRIKFTDNFEFVGFEGDSAPTSVTVAEDRSFVEWDMVNRYDVLSTLADGNPVSFKVVVKLRDGVSVTGQVDVIDISDSFVRVYNKCGVEEKNFAQIIANIGAEIPPEPQPSRCSVCDDSQRIMRLNQTKQGALGAVYSGSATDFPCEICYNQIFGVDYPIDSGVHDCDGTNNFVLGLDTDGFGFVESSVNNVCYGDLECKKIDSGECESGYGCIVSLSANENANFAVCDPFNAYDKKICCRRRNFVNDAYWTDAFGKRTTHAGIGDKVKMVFKSPSITSGGSYKFDIKEFDSGIFDVDSLNADEYIKTIDNVISENGKVVAEWTITQGDWYEADEDSEARFYFEVNEKGMDDIGYSRDDDLIVAGEGGQVIGDWTCDNDELYSQWVSGEGDEILKTDDGSSSCKRDGETCCPTGAGWECLKDSEGKWRCVSETSSDICEGIITCSDYNTANFGSEEAAKDACNEDICGRGGYGVWSVTRFPSECLPEERKIEVDKITKIKTINSCVWVGGEGEEGECRQNRTIKWRYKGDDFWASCFNSFEITKGCGVEPDRDTVEISVSVEEVEWSEPLPDELNVNVEECKNKICPGDKLELVCPGPVLRLPFFNWAGFVCVYLVLILFYWKKFHKG